MTITNQPSGKSRKSTNGIPPPPSRLPAVRERRPALAALAVLLIVGGAVGAGWLALREGHTSSYLYVKHEIPLGQQITPDDIGTIELSDTGLDLIPASERSSLANLYAQTVLEPGTILIQSFVGEAVRNPEGLQTVGYPLSPGDYPSTMRVGDTAQLSVSRNGDGPPVTTTAYVISFDSSDSSNAQTVNFYIADTCGDDFASSTAAGDVFVSTIEASDEVTGCNGGPSVPLDFETGD